jgi:hypothetical protein
MANPVGTLVGLALPVGEWQAKPLPEGTIFVRPADLQHSEGSFESASFRFWVGTVDANQASFGDVLRDLMRKRLPQGRPEFDRADVAGSPAIRSDWGDGTTRVHSYFVQHPAGAIVELALGSMYFATGALKVPLEPMTERLFACVRWL